MMQILTVFLAFLQNLAAVWQLKPTTTGVTSGRLKFQCMTAAVFSNIIILVIVDVVVVIVQFRRTCLT